MRIVILAYQDCSLWALASIQEIFETCNCIYQRFKSEKYFEIYIAGRNKGVVPVGYGNNFNIEYSFDDIPNPDLLFVPGSFFGVENIVRRNSPEIDYIKESYNSGSMLASFCTGTFLIAASGVLKNKRASTHWLRVDEFKNMFPDVLVNGDKIITDEGDICLAGGATSAQNLCIYLIEKFLGKKYAIATAKTLLIDMNKDDQTSYAMFLPQKEHSDNEILKIQNYIEENYSDKFSISSLADKICCSQRTFLRRFKKATGETPGNYIQRVKVESAKRMLEHTDQTFEEIVREVGYEDISSFRELFKRITGLAPREYRHKYSFNI